MTSLKAEQLQTHEVLGAEEKFVDVTVTSDKSEVKEPITPLEQSNGVSPEKEESSHKYILLPCTVKVKCGGCGKEAEVNADDTSPDFTEAPYICEICKSRAQKKLRLHQLINGGNFAQEPERTEPRRKHPCPHCSKEFNSQKDMKRHTNIHTGLKPYTCETCGKAFSQSCSLKRHLVTHTDAKPHRCEICGLTFKGHLARHMRSHTGEKPFTCEICQKGFYRSELLKRHLAEHMTDGSVSCSKSQLDDIFQRSLTKQHTCLICDKTYSNSGHLARHMKQHNNENVLRCGVCTKVFFVKEELQEHLQGHSKEDLAAIIAGTLMPTMTNGSPNPSTDDEAPLEEEPNEEVSSPLDLPPQDTVPEGEPGEHACLEDRVTCGICGHACCCTNYIPVHMENHEETMVQCQSCGMDFAPTGASGSQICNLCKSQEAGMEAEPETDDIKGDVPDDAQDDVQEDGPIIEDEEKRHKCLECDKSYKYIKHLREHARIHAGGYRPYKCNTCGKSFTKRYHLNRHQLIHGRLMQRRQNQSRMMVGLKPKVGRPLQNIVTKPRVGRPRFTETKPVVPVKEYRYVKPKVQPGGMPFVCSACGKGFPKRVPLKRHLLNHLHAGTIPKDHPQLDEMKVNSYVNANVGDAPSPQLQTCPICTKVCKGLHIHRHMKVHTQEEIAKYKEMTGGASPEAQQQEQKQGRPRLKSSSGPVQGEMDFERDESPMDGEDSEEGIMEEDYGPMPDSKDISLVLGEGKPEEVKEHDCLEDKVTCGICGHSCCCANYITVHMEIHNDESDKCGKCGKELGDLPSTYVKGGRICSICASRSRKQLRLHQILRNRVIQQESSSTMTKKRFECQHCPKSFTDRKYFREHLRIHTGEKRYHCSFCGMAFAHSRNFKRHVWRHTGEKPNWCNICNKGIAGHLARHMRSHSDEKSYVCNMCHKGFNRSEHLKRHLKTHLGSQEEFQCHLCPKKYLRKEHLKRHIRSHGDGTLALAGGTSSNILGPAVKPIHPPVNDQPYREHPCTYDVAVCGLCGDACCCANYLPFHMEVHGEKAEDYIEPHNLKNDVLVKQDGFVEKKIRDHSCTYDPVTCGLCGEVCCCANYIPLHMELHGERATDLAKDHIIKKEGDGVIENAEVDYLQKTPETPHIAEKQVNEHSCLHDKVNCGICGEACCCANYIPFHMEQHDEKSPDPVSQDDILKKALDASDIGDDHVRPHPCLHEIVNCGICGEPCCCANYIPFHIELHSEVMDQEPIIQEEVVCVANPESSTDHEVAETIEYFPEREATSEEDLEAVGTQEEVADQEAVVAPEAGEEQVVNNGSAVVEEHVEEFDWASVANFLQGTHEPDPLPVPPLLASGSNMEPVNGLPVKEEPTVSHVDENQVTDHMCLQAQVTCETCGDILCCINNLIAHLDTHKVMIVRCDICQQDVEITKTVSVLKEGTKIYKCGTCVMGVSVMSPSPSRTTQVRVGEQRGVVDKRIPCPHCPRVLKSRKEYTRHVKIHAEVKPYKCDICDKEFTAMANLRRHLDAHAGVKPHECKICGQFFSGHMARHMRTHTGEKKYSCEICAKGFHRLEHLKRHLGQHLKDGSATSDHKQLRE